MKLLLSGGGDPEQVVELDTFFANYIKKGKVLYIPVAMDKIPYDDCLSWFKKTYNNYGINNIEMCTDLTKCDLKGYKAVFIGGGNTFKLLKLIKESHFDKKIKEYLNNGGFVYGGSAGAIIFGKSIETSSHADKNYVNLKDTSGINLLNEFDIWCHYNDKNKLLGLKNKTYILYEESGIYFCDDKIIPLGKKYFTIL